VVGELPELAEERKLADESLRQFEEQLEKLETNINYLKILQQSGQLTDDKREMLARTTKAKFQIMAQRDATQKRLTELADEMEKNKSTGCVRVKSACHPGVTLTIRGVRYLVRETLNFTKFVYEEGEVRIKAFA
jgi:uncharacterized protein (DUF342 family)